jgi:hypothetical protein
VGRLAQGGPSRFLTEIGGSTRVGARPDVRVQLDCAAPRRSFFVRIAALAGLSGHGMGADRSNRTTRIGSDGSKAAVVHPLMSRTSRTGLRLHKQLPHPERVGDGRTDLSPQRAALRLGRAMWENMGGDRFKIIDPARHLQPRVRCGNRYYGVRRLLFLMPPA